ncbi:MAG TPA: DNA-formamidopyrimidine glycosylase family protein [Vicinamibacteria bacterium]|nr:DNA-formamidopyrimidine glycosylase family protein [Vicinamibacteria bacterium]
MPELPDLLHVLARLRQALLGQRVTAERLREPVVLRCLVQGNLSLLLGRALTDVQRHAHFLVFRLEGLDLAVNPMLAGRFKLAAPGDREEAALAFALTFGETGTELRYLDDKKMGKAYLTQEGDWRAIPGLGEVGVDVLSTHFTPERFASLLRHRRDQVRAFLLDKRALDSLGNAYADEVLFEAGIHPKTFCRSLSHDDALRLHAAIVKVMTEAVAEVARRDEPIEVKVRDFLKVRLKTDCPRCGSKIRRAGVRGMDAYFCPRCQPATRSALVDWTKAPR